LGAALLFLDASFTGAKPFYSMDAPDSITSHDPGFMRRVEWLVRLWVFIGLLILVILPTVAVGFAAWLLVSDLQPEAAAAATYRSAPPAMHG
jgi:hypothetical protein